MEKIIRTEYEIEFIEDSDNIYHSGDFMKAQDFIEDYCACNSPEMEDNSQWLRNIPVPDAIAYICEAWGIAYRLHKYTTTEQVVWNSTIRPF